MVHGSIRAPTTLGIPSCCVLAQPALVEAVDLVEDPMTGLEKRQPKFALVLRDRQVNGVVNPVPFEALA